jgi:hypothetical protein
MTRHATVSSAHGPRRRATFVSAASPTPRVSCGPDYAHPCISVVVGVCVRNVVASSPVHSRRVMQRRRVVWGRGTRVVWDCRLSLVHSYRRRAVGRSGRMNDEALRWRSHDDGNRIVERADARPQDPSHEASERASQRARVTATTNTRRGRTTPARAIHKRTPWHTREHSKHYAQGKLCVLSPAQSTVTSRH